MVYRKVTGNEMQSMQVQVGWTKDFIAKNTPVRPIAGQMGGNVLKEEASCPPGSRRDSATGVALRRLGSFRGQPQALSQRSDPAAPSRG